MLLFFFFLRGADNGAAKKNSAKRNDFSRFPSTGSFKSGFPWRARCAFNRVPRAVRPEQQLASSLVSCASTTHQRKQQPADVENTDIRAIFSLLFFGLKRGGGGSAPFVPTKSLYKCRCAVTPVAVSLFCSSAPLLPGSSLCCGYAILLPGQIS